MQKVSHISVAAKNAIEYLDKRRRGEEKSLKLPHWKLNKSLLNGIPWGRVLTLGGLSGTGKSTIIEQWKRGLVELNRDQPLEVLAFEYEMLPVDSIIRSIAGKTQTSTSYLQSADNNTLTEEELKKYESIASEIANYPIFYVEDSGTPTDMKNTILNFANQRDLKERDVGLVVTIDHVTLTKGKDSDAEKRVIDELYKIIVDLKKKFSSEGIKCLFILLSQLNREIMSVERKKATLHYPVSSDLFGASSIYQGSDYVLITHNPSVISGISAYGPPCGDKYPEGLPIYCPKTGRQMIYWHLIKNRFGKTAIMIMRENFVASEIEDYVEDEEQEEK